MTKIELFGTPYDFPSSWEELTPVQLERVCGFLLQPWSPALQYLLIRLLLPIHPRRWTKLTDSEILALLPITDFLQTPILPKEFKVFRLGLRGYWLPNRLKIRTVDWTQSEPLIQQFAKTGEQKYLDHLLVTVCRPLKWWIVFFPWFKNFALNWDGDPREKYHSALTEIRAKKVSKIPMHKKLSVFWWMVQLRWEVYKIHKPVFSGSGKGDKGDWVECVMDLAERGLFGDLQSTFQTNFHLVLKYLHKEKKRQKQ
jgi:hypothetical protein